MVLRAMLIQGLKKCLLNSHYVPSTVLGPRDSMASTTWALNSRNFKDSKIGFLSCHLGA